MLHIADLTVSTPELIRELGRSIDRKTRLLPVPPALMTRAAQMLGRGEEARRLLGSLELDSAASWHMLGIEPPFDPRAELHAAVQHPEVAEKTGDR